MKTVVLASTNPIKAQATRDGFHRMFPGEMFEITAIQISSGVGDQPLTDAETLRGAIQRAQGAHRAAPEAAYWVGIEGGVEATDGGLAAFAWVAVLSADLQGQGRTGTFFLPPVVARLVQKGIELGEADDIVFRQANSKQKNGAVGLLTGDVIDRAALYAEAVILALVPFKNPDLYT